MAGAAAMDSASLTPSEQVVWGGFYASGVIAMLVIYGVLQERIMQVPYGGEVFTFSVFLVLLNRTAAVAYAVVMASYHRESLRNKAPLWKYLIVSFANVYASTCQYEALKYVSFAVQMLGKSFKMLPVMVWGILINGKSYGWKDWLIASAVTGGVTQFLMTGPTAAARNDSGSSLMGLLLLLAFLILDGLTSTMQEKLFKEHTTSKYNQMLYINSLSACVSLGTLLMSGQMRSAVGFLFAHGDFAFQAGLLSASAVGGQFFIYSTVQSFGALVLAATMNVRQVCSIIVSYITYKHTITLLQVAGLAVVFSALFLKTWLGLAAAAKAANERMPLSRKDEGEGNKDPRLAYRSTADCRPAGATLNRASERV